MPKQVSLKPSKLSVSILDPPLGRRLRNCWFVDISGNFAWVLSFYLASQLKCLFRDKSSSETNMHCGIWGRPVGLNLGEAYQVSKSLLHVSHTEYRIIDVRGERGNIMTCYWITVDCFHIHSLLPALQSAPIWRTPHVMHLMSHLPQQPMYSLSL